MDYDYLEHVTSDVLDAIREDYTEDEVSAKLLKEEDFAEELHEQFWDSDSVTGNLSGSYTFSTYKAEEYLAHNWSLLIEAAEAFGQEAIISESWENGAEFWDVTIRCYLLGQAISAALEELKKERGMTND